ncbi:hypothetical protein MMC09_006382 [Bachmanniomyces sp. S44760]|nr:hypothetical protein [Bachmanniomyces sp. S44760]
MLRLSVACVLASALLGSALPANSEAKPTATAGQAHGNYDGVIARALEYIAGRDTLAFPTLAPMKNAGVLYPRAYGSGTGTGTAGPAPTEGPSPTGGGGDSPDGGSSEGGGSSMGGGSSDANGHHMGNFGTGSHDWVGIASTAGEILQANPYGMPCQNGCGGNNGDKYTPTTEETSTHTTATEPESTTHSTGTEPEKTETTSSTSPTATGPDTKTSEPTKDATPTTTENKPAPTSEDKPSPTEDKPSPTENKPAPTEDPPKNPCKRKIHLFGGGGHHDDDPAKC